MRKGTKLIYGLFPIIYLQQYCKQRFDKYPISQAIKEVAVKQLKLQGIEYTKEEMDAISYQQFYNRNKANLKTTTSMRMNEVVKHSKQDYRYQHLISSLLLCSGIALSRMAVKRRMNPVAFTVISQGIYLITFQYYYYTRIHKILHKKQLPLYHKFQDIHTIFNTILIMTMAGILSLAGFYKLRSVSTSKSLVRRQ